MDVKEGAREKGINQEAIRKEDSPQKCALHQRGRREEPVQL